MANLDMRECLTATITRKTSHFPFPCESSCQLGTDSAQPLLWYTFVLTIVLDHVIWQPLELMPELHLGELEMYPHACTNYSTLGLSVKGNEQASVICGLKQ